MIEIKDKALCCGCSACVSICPKQCIIMQSDNEGFLYPSVNKEHCVNCGKCEQVCPIIKARNGEKPHNVFKKAYAVQNKDKKILYESTSGGFFTALAQYVINRGGYVIGASYNDSFYIRHNIVNDKKNLKQFRNSKYCQSDINGMYIKCKELLSQGQIVCFSGTPCQIAGLYSYLESVPDNLITVDVICRGVGSPLFFKKFVNDVKSGGSIKNIVFRDKKYGYYASCMFIYYRNRKIKRPTMKENSLNAFYFSGLISRPSCYDCHFKSIDRYSDFTIYDCWHAEKLSKKMNDKGTTGVIVRNEKARKILYSIKNEVIFDVIDLTKAINFDGIMMLKSAVKNDKRDDVFRDLYKYTNFQTVMRKYRKYACINPIKYNLKMIMCRIGLFQRYMKMKFQ